MFFKTGQLIDREKNQVVKEHVPTFDWLRLSFLHANALGRLIAVSQRMRTYLATQTKSKAELYDDPESKTQIARFISNYGIDTADVLLPLEEFATLNEFFFRKLTPASRPIAGLSDENKFVQPADCRLHVFPSVSAATRLYIKGTGFSLENLVGSDFKHHITKGSSLAICRLAPQDYHRFHSPFSGIVGKQSWLGEDYYTVKPVAINSPLNVLCLNRRVAIELLTPLGPIIFVAVGAVHVGSIKLSVAESDAIKKGDELGHFAYGGSTVVVVFPKGAVLFDPDLLGNSSKGNETLVRFGDSLGVRRSSEALTESELFGAPARVPFGLALLTLAIAISVVWARKSTA